MIHRSISYSVATAILLAASGAARVHADEATAVFASGCFWCVEADFEKVDGVLEAVSGYAGGATDNPTYKSVSSNTTGHAEVVQVVYDPSVVSYEELLDVFWVNTDPFDAGGQFCDRGSSYRTEIFYADEAQREAALASKEAAEAYLGKEIVTPVTPLETFYEAESYHQDYYKKHALRYGFYRNGCGRDARLNAVWGDDPEF